MIRLVVWGCFLLSLVACSRAHFVTPPVESPFIQNEPYESGYTPAPLAVEKIKEVFTWKQASGEFNLAVVLHLEWYNKAAFARLRELARNLNFKLRNQMSLNQFDQIRVAFILEKPSVLSSAASQWVSAYPKTQSIEQIRDIVRSQIDSAEQDHKAHLAEEYPENPFNSLVDVMNSFPSYSGQSPSAAHLIYLRDRDLFQSKLETSRNAFISALHRKPWLGSYASAGFFGFLDENSSKQCKPNDADYALNISKLFSGAFLYSGELCEIPLDTFEKAISNFSKAQGRVLLKRPAKPESIEVKIQSIAIPTHTFRYSAAEREIDISSNYVKTGDLVEVEYEPKD